MKIETLCLHADNNVKDEFGTITTPIYAAATFVHKGVGIPSDYTYSRLSNPTRAHLENTMKVLENGEFAIAFSSGMAALSTVLRIFHGPAHIIASNDLYGGSLKHFREINTYDGFSFDYVDTACYDEVERLINENTKAIYVETPSNPLMQVTDIERIAEIAHKHNLLLIVDNTFMTPYFQRPLDLGADIVLHSGTKYLGGHNDCLAGFIVTKTKELGDKVLYYAKTMGANLDPFDSFLVERGIKTLALRMERISSNSLEIAKWLVNEPKVKKVYYIGLPTHPSYEVTLKQSTGFSGMISIEVESPELAVKILNSVKVFQYAESLGGVDSLITYPMLQTHADVPKEERDRRGINDRFLRISVGIENVEDLIDDLKQAMYE
ncbi:MAG: trans-sulfuration enzyme family protein [Anaeroplasma sp.]